MDDIGGQEINALVLAHPDWLTHFSFNWFAQQTGSNGCHLTVFDLEHLSPESETVQHMLTIVYCVSSRLVGLRKNQKSLEKTPPDCDAAGDFPPRPRGQVFSKSGK